MSVDDPAVLLLLLDFAVIGALPRVFFRADGRLNGKWWLTALPFGLCPVFVAGAVTVGWDSPGPDPWNTGLRLAAVVLNASSIALMFLTLGTHRIPVALWHQENDAPRHIVTYGAYSRIRHPFYAAFLLAFLAGFVLFPHGVTLMVLGYGLTAMRVTAVREEKRLSASEFGAEYQRYMARTGRFVPALGKGRRRGARRVTPSLGRVGPPEGRGNQP